MTMRTITARYGLAAWLLGLALVAALSLVTIRLPGYHLDKLGHFLAYFALTALAFRLWPSGWRPWVVAALLLLFGGGIELAQLHIAERQASWRDMAFNIAGILTAMLMACRGQGQSGTHGPGGPHLAGRARSRAETNEERGIRPV